MKRLLLIITTILFFTTLIFPQSKVNKNNLIQYGNKWFKENNDKHSQVEFLIYIKVMGIKREKVILKMDYRTGNLLNGMKMDKKEKKQLTRIVNTMDYLRNGMRMERRRKRETTMMV